MARVMTLLAWLMFLALVTVSFTKILKNREEPNQKLAQSTASEVVLTRNSDGHYVAPGKINGHSVQFLVDTGASNVAIPAEVASVLELPRGTTGYASTANGTTETRRMLAKTVSLGGIVVRNVSVSVLPNAHGEHVLLGMSFLKHLKITQYKGQLTLSH